MQITGVVKLIDTVGKYSSLEVHVRSDTYETLAFKQLKQINSSQQPVTVSIQTERPRNLWVTHENFRIQFIRTDYESETAEIRFIPI